MSGAVFAGTADLSLWNKAVAAGLTGTNRAAQEWLGAGGFPEPVGAVLSGAGEPWATLAPVLLLPEHKVALPGGSMAAQGDVLCLARHDSGLMTLAVEGKTDEGFGADLERWQRETASGRKTRLAYLGELLGVPLPMPNDLRYRFLGRMASAIIEAKRFHAGAATLLVQSHSAKSTGFADFARFAAVMGAPEPATTNTPIPLGKRDGVERYVLWISTAG